ncbi:hypothetical protein Pla123a_25730 [Posidoniimonas polymericola]|uniref:DUF3592 domain-containing protein n=1 Tax=Posidoniimonas polymericola TaxID=2528002 RepID=A0A5C5YQA1_9BACT|nr:hypothetical protein [Posidoniimonas polymericola]TWT77142.1 hypothetical protein Pla123a_25730 [Posidoniimonas polymericola]
MQNFTKFINVCVIAALVFGGLALSSYGRFDKLTRLGEGGRRATAVVERVWDDRPWYQMLGSSNTAKHQHHYRAVISAPEIWSPSRREVALNSKQYFAMKAGGATPIVYLPGDQDTYFVGSPSQARQSLEQARMLAKWLGIGAVLSVVTGVCGWVICSSRRANSYRLEQQNGGSPDGSAWGASL